MGVDTKLDVIWTLHCKAFEIDWVKSVSSKTSSVEAEISDGLPKGDHIRAEPKRLSHLFFKLYFRFFGPKSLPSKNIFYFLQIFAIIWICPKIWNYLSKAENSCIYFECNILCVIWKFYPLCDRSHRINFCMTNARCHSKFFFFWMTYIMWHTTD